MPVEGYTKPTEPMKIGQRMSVARAAMDGYIKKDTQVEGYMAVTHDLVTAHVRQPLIDAGINVIVDDVELVCDTLTTKKGTKMQVRRLLVEVLFVNSDDQEDYQCFHAWGEATDLLDKAIQKARSIAVKNIYLKAFCIETGESDEPRFPVEPDAEPEVELISHEHLAELLLQLEERNKVDSFLAHCRERTGRPIQNPKELSEDDYKYGMMMVARIVAKEAEEKFRAGNDNAGTTD